MTMPNFNYIIADNEVTITGYKGSATEVIIPSEIEGKPVKSIGMYALDNRRSLMSIEIPDSVTSIGDWAFAYCSSLASVTIPNRVKSIGISAFYGCSNLINIKIPESVKRIDVSAFEGCSSLKDVYYLGTKEQWEKIAIDRHNHALNKAKKHFK